MPSSLDCTSRAWSQCKFNILYISVEDFSFNSFYVSYMLYSLKFHLSNKLGTCVHLSLEPVFFRASEIVNILCTVQSFIRQICIWFMWSLLLLLFIVYLFIIDAVYDVKCEYELWY